MATTERNLLNLREPTLWNTSRNW